MSDFIFDNVELNVQVPSPVMNYQDKEVFVVDEVGVTVRPDNGYDALASVDINPVLESKVVNVTSNGTTSVVPSDGFCGIGDISVNVNVPVSNINDFDIKFKGIYCDVTSPMVYSRSFVQSDLVDASGLSQISIPGSSYDISIFIGFLFPSSVSDIAKIKKCSFCYGRSLTAPLNENILGFGFHPSYIVHYVVPCRSIYSSLSPPVASSKFLSCTFNFDVVRSSDGFVIGSVSFKRDNSLNMGWSQTSSFSSLF